MLDILRSTYRPEFLNRLDELVIFNPLQKTQLAAIARLALKSLSSRLANLHPNLHPHPHLSPLTSHPHPHPQVAQQQVWAGLRGVGLGAGLGLGLMSGLGLGLGSGLGLGLGSG